MKAPCRVRLHVLVGEERLGVLGVVAADDRALHHLGDGGFDRLAHLRGHDRAEALLLCSEEFCRRLIFAERSANAVRRCAPEENCAERVDSRSFLAERGKRPHRSPRHHRALECAKCLTGICRIAKTDRALQMNQVRNALKCLCYSPSQFVQR